MKANQYFIYLFRVKSTGEVIYVGSCIHIAERLNEHRRAFKEPKRVLPIHQYMIDNGLELFRDVEVCIVEYFAETTKEKALEVEADYYYKYRPTLKNCRPAEIRGGEFGTRNKPVICLNDEQSFASVRLAALHYGLNRATLMCHLNKGTILKSGLIFKYAIDSQNVDRKLYRIMCVEDDKYFGTYKACAENYGFTTEMFSARMRDKDTFKIGDKTFVKCND